MMRRLDYVQEEVRVLKEALAAATCKMRIDFSPEQRRRLVLKGKDLTATERQACCQNRQARDDPRLAIEALVGEKGQGGELSRARGVVVQKTYPIGRRDERDEGTTGIGGSSSTPKRARIASALSAPSELASIGWTQATRPERRRYEKGE